MSRATTFPTRLQADSKHSDLRWAHMQSCRQRCAPVQMYVYYCTFDIVLLLLILLIWVLRPFQEYSTYIEPIVHHSWGKTGEPGENT